MTLDWTAPWLGTRRPAPLSMLTTHGCRVCSAGSLSLLVARSAAFSSPFSFAFDSGNRTPALLSRVISRSASSSRQQATGVGVSSFSSLFSFLLWLWHGWLTKHGFKHCSGLMDSEQQQQQYISREDVSLRRQLARGVRLDYTRTERQRQLDHITFHYTWTNPEGVRPT